MTPNAATIDTGFDRDCTSQDRRSGRNRERNTLAIGRNTRLQTTAHRVSDPVNMSRAELHTTLSATTLEDLDDACDFAQLDEIDAVNDGLDDLGITWDDTFDDDDSDLFGAEDGSLWADVAATMAAPITR